MQKYFDIIEEEVKCQYKIAEKARARNIDPESHVEITLAKNMAERVLGLISTVAPQIKDSKLVKEIQKLEKEFGVLDWRVAFRIAEEVAKQNICRFDSEKEAIEVGIRTGFAYVTVGVVSACLEGFTKLELKKTKDGRDYFSLYFSGPIRNAGGTAAAVCILIADYVRKKMGYAAYDAAENEVKRAWTEIQDYHERVTNLQYFPSQKELFYLVENIPVEINGEPTEKIEVSNYKNLPRIETNLIRGGYCLIYSSCIPLKAPKLWKQIEKWGRDFDMGQWNFLEKFIKIQKEEAAKSTSLQQSEEKEEAKIKPNYTYIADLVAGRPVLAHPLQKGGFRLRYGRSRCSGDSGQSIHPATMHVLNKSLATGTQVKLERPGKGTVFTSCSSIEGPIVKLENNDVVFVETVSQARQLQDKITEILFIGDILCCYGDFFNRAHTLIPPGYCEEWWVQELEKHIVDTFGSLDTAKVAGLADIEEEKIKALLKNPYSVSAVDAITLSRQLGVPLHPRYTYHWKDISREDFYALLEAVKKAQIKSDVNVNKIILPFDEKSKRVLELLGVPHLMATDYVVIEKDDALAFYTQLSNFDVGRFIEAETDDVLEILNKRNSIKMRDKSGIYIGARMGRPEKAKMRKLKGSPHGLFPVGDEGGKMRAFQAALGKGYVFGSFPLFNCEKCEHLTIYPTCEKCGSACKRMYSCRQCGLIDKRCEHRHEAYTDRKINISHYFNNALQVLGLDKDLYPDMIKGIRGTINHEHLLEHLAKAILRAKHNINVNKDGTVRYDCTEIPLTHFKPKEIDVSIEKLKELGYELDIYGKELVSEEQILELKPQDIVIPCCPEIDDPCDRFLLKTAAFIDELLEKVYGIKPYFNFKTRQDLVGCLLIGLAPHTSAGSVCRVIGFSKNQGIMAHPLFHSALRRDCVAYDSFVPVYDGKKWAIKKIGEFVESFNLTDTVDENGTLGKQINGYFTLGYDSEKRSMRLAPIKEVTKHRPSPTLKIIAENGRDIETTFDHIVYINKGGEIVEKRAGNLKKNDLMMVPHSFSVPNSKGIDSISIPEAYEGNDLMIYGVNDLMRKKIASKRIQFCRKYGLKQHSLKNYLSRDSWPAHLINRVLGKIPSFAKVSIKRDNIKLPVSIKIGKEALWLLGIYIAEGFSRKNSSGKGYYQVSFAASEKFVRSKIRKICKSVFGLVPSYETKDALIYSSKIFYLFFTKFLDCGASAYKKKIPSELLGLSSESLRYLLQGYFDGDGSTDSKELRVSCDTVSEQLIEDLYFVFSRYGIYFRKYRSTRVPGKHLMRFYVRKGRAIPKFTSTKITIPSNYCAIFAQKIGFSLPRKQRTLLANLKTKKFKGTKVNHDSRFTYLKVVAVENSSSKTTYCLNVGATHNFVANNFVVHNCDGDEAGIFLLMDGLLNFSQKFLPGTRGSTMDAPLVLTSILNPSEVDDMVFDMDTAWKYPLEFYKACAEYRKPWDVKIERVADRLGKPEQYENYGFTHDNIDFNRGVLISSYKTLPAMKDKLLSQMDLAEKIRAVDTSDVAALVINKHFIKDIKGNLRKFSQQEFRCVSCNAKYRRPPLIGKCTSCNGKIIFTISEGSVIKYYQPSMELAEKYNLPPYLKQTLQLTRQRIESVFGKEKEIQQDLGKWF